VFFFFFFPFSLWRATLSLFIYLFFLQTSSTVLPNLNSVGGRGRAGGGGGGVVGFLI